MFPSCIVFGSSLSLEACGTCKTPPKVQQEREYFQRTICRKQGAVVEIQTSQCSNSASELLEQKQSSTEKGAQRHRKRSDIPSQRYLLCWAQGHDGPREHEGGGTERGRGHGNTRAQRERAEKGGTGEEAPRRSKERGQRQRSTEKGKRRGVAVEDEIEGCGDGPKADKLQNLFSVKTSQIE